MDLVSIYIYAHIWFRCMLKPTACAVLPFTSVCRSTFWRISYVACFLMTRMSSALMFPMPTLLLMCFPQRLWYTYWLHQSCFLKIWLWSGTSAAYQQIHLRSPHPCHHSHHLIVHKTGGALFHFSASFSLSVCFLLFLFHQPPIHFFCCSAVLPLLCFASQK